MKLTVSTIPHSKRRYETAGDWLTDSTGDIHCLVSEMGNRDYEFLLGLHELIEAYLCQRDGVTQQEVDIFDFKFEKERHDGIHGTDEEPGAHPDAPYRVQHSLAESIERVMAFHMGIKWEDYDAAVRAL